MTTAAERLVALAGAGGQAGTLMLMVGTGTTAGAALVEYSHLQSGTAEEHLLVDHAMQQSFGSLIWLTGPFKKAASPTVRKVIKKVAKRQVEEASDLSQEAYEAQLAMELAKLDLQYKAIYAAALAEERERILHAEISRLFALKKMREQDEDVLAVLMAML